MNPRVHLRLLAVFGLLAVFTAQVFGMALGYQCDCTGVVRWTAQDHCHGPHHDRCHDDETPGHQHHEGDGAGERHDHQRVHAEVDSRMTPPAVDAPLLVPVLIAVFGVDTQWVSSMVPRIAWKEVPADTGPPLGVAVARTTVLLI